MKKRTSHCGRVITLQYTPPRTYVFEPIRTYGTFDLPPTENATETNKYRDQKISFVGFSPSTRIFKDMRYLQILGPKTYVLGREYCKHYACFRANLW